MNTVPGRMLTDPDWLTARIAEMGRSWGTGAARVGGTLWWCMVASALVEPVARAYAAGERAPLAQLDRIGCDVRPDGGVDRIIFIGSSDLVEEAAGPAVEPTEDLPRSGNASIGDHAEDDHPGRSGGATTRERAGSSEDLGPSGGSRPGGEGFHDAEAAAGDQDRSAPARSAAGTALHDTLAAVIAQIAAVSGARAPARWAVVADANGNPAIDAGVPEAGTRLAGEIGGKLPAPRYVEIGDRTFVRRISCCLVYEVPGCEMCTSCPKRPSAEREQLLTRMAAQD
ncbi:(2Fe-2S)-binding protein [Nocardia cyriacigeorgica]|uniref:(2Fe-2S)-binding protein n=1 Tax=Nocardia cyriacigeorgica TaxID=135487 RepID=UPI002458E91B|nr:(2Fe-2S)-binding protein [Nocardia cyriacigeorgica]